MRHETSEITPTALGLLAHMLRDAQAMVRDQVALPSDVDLAMRLGARHPVGPLTLIGSLDVTTRRELGLGAEADVPATPAAQDPQAGGAGSSSDAFPEGRPWSDAPVGVVGTGFMASGIAYAIAVSGQRALVLGRSDAAVRSASASTARAVDLAAERDRLNGQSVQQVLGRIAGTCDCAELDACDLVIEAVAEDLAIKRAVFAELDKTLPNAELLATNTSSLRVHDIAADVGRTDRVGALHFFSPVPAMKLVELAQTAELPDATVSRAAAWARSIGKVPVRCADRTGFIVNSLLIPLLNDVVRASTEGVGTPAELDEILVTEAGHPMGAFQLLDFIGLDVSLAAQEAIFAAEPGNERLRPASSLVEHVERGDLGRKSGRGFYDYASVEVNP